MPHSSFKLIPFLTIVVLLLPLPTLSQNTSCPLDFTILNKFLTAAQSSSSAVPTDTPTRCSYALHGLHLLLAQHLLTTSLFLPPPSSAASCWSAYQSLTSPIFPPPFNLLSDCGFSITSISTGCMNITTRSQFDSIVPVSARLDLSRSCNQTSLALSSPCTACTTSLNRVKSAYLPGPDYSNVSDCTAYPSIYAGAYNRFGPADNGTALCLFLLNASPNPSTPSHHSSSAAWAYGVAVACFVLLSVPAWLLFRRCRDKQRRRRRRMITKSAELDRHNASSLALESMAASTSLIKLTIEDIRAATENFSRENIIGQGGFGNVYRGVLPDGSEVALKRFKNCSAAGDASFAHEVEVIASVRHVNLVALRGYCTATTELEGYQRIIVCDLMRNGSLHDHLFGWREKIQKKLSWPIRKRIALGTARGLAYLHYGAQPAIIHRDIKASNILLDDTFEPQVADFGLAKFAPEGVSHVSTRVAGTLGYVAPEYALYGQVTERTDVYSFGVVMLELLSGKKAFTSMGDGQTFLVTDWAWSLVRTGRALDVIEEGMDDLEPKEVLEKYVLVAVLCSHPQMHARPTMDEIVKILETDVAAPSIPDRPIPLTASRDDIEASMSSSGGSGQLSNLSEFQLLAIGSIDASSDYLRTV